MESENLIQSLFQKLLAQYQPRKVILYGSYAYGNPRPNSDIDLLIIKDTKGSCYMKLEIPLSPTIGFASQKRIGVASNFFSLCAIMKPQDSIGNKR